MNLKIAILIPCGHPKAAFIEALGRLVAHTAQTEIIGGGRVEFDILVGQSALIFDLRMRMTADAMKNNPDYLLYIDDDMSFPPDGLVQLLNHNLPVVAANYTRRALPCNPVARKADDSDWIFTVDESTGLELAMFTGFGFVLVKSGVIRALEQAGKLPFFLAGYEPHPKNGKDRLFGEDTFFFRCCAELGIDCVIDHDLSKKIIHWGDWGFDYRMAKVDEELTSSMASAA